MAALTHLFLGVGVVIKWVLVDWVKVEQMNRILEWTELSFSLISSLCPRVVLILTQELETGTPCKLRIAGLWADFTNCCVRGSPSRSRPASHPLSLFLRVRCHSLGLHHFSILSFSQQDRLTADCDAECTLPPGEQCVVCPLVAVLTFWLQKHKAHDCICWPFSQNLCHSCHFPDRKTHCWLFFQKGNSGYFNFWVMWYVFEAKCCL